MKRSRRKEKFKISILTHFEYIAHLEFPSVTCEAANKGTGACLKQLRETMIEKALEWMASQLTLAKVNVLLWNHTDFELRIKSH